MIKVNVRTYGIVNKEAGWDSKEVKLEQARVTAEDILRSVALQYGGALFDLVADERGVKEDYTVLLNDSTLRSAEDLKREIKDEDQIMALGIIEAIGGG